MTAEVARRRWGLSELEPLAETATSTLWRAASPDQGAVVLKQLKPYGRDEIHGIRLLQALNGVGAVRVHAQAGDDILMEHLPGPPNLVRRGDDAGAAAILADVAAQIGGAEPTGLVPLADHLRALLRADTLAPDLGRARDLARELLGAGPERSTAICIMTTSLAARAAG